MEGTVQNNTLIEKGGECSETEEMIPHMKTALGTKQKINSHQGMLSWNKKISGIKKKVVKLKSYHGFMEDF